jgi:hypothetical protein
MPLDPRQRHAVLKADRTKDASWVRAVIEQLRSADPTVTLLEVEQTLRAAAGSAFLVADDAGFRIVVGMKAWVAELDKLGRTPEQNRQALAGEPT